MKQQQEACLKDSNKRKRKGKRRSSKGKKKTDRGICNNLKMNMQSSSLQGREDAHSGEAHRHFTSLGSTFSHPALTVGGHLCANSSLSRHTQIPASGQPVAAAVLSWFCWCMEQARNCWDKHRLSEVPSWHNSDPA